MELLFIQILKFAAILIRNYHRQNAFLMTDSISYSSFNVIVLPCSMLLVQVSDINNCIWCGLLADDMQPKLSTSRRRAVERAGGVAAAACGRNNDGGGEEASGGGRLPAWGGGGFGRKPVPMEGKGIGHAGFVDPGGSRGVAHRRAGEQN